MPWPEHLHLNQFTRSIGIIARNKVPERVRAGTVKEFAELGYLAIESPWGDICILSDGEGYFALSDTCPHMGAEIHRGEVVGGIVICPMHRARFELKSGKSLDIYATDLASYPVAVEDGVIFIEPAPRDT